MNNQEILNQIIKKIGFNPLDPSIFQGDIIDDNTPSLHSLTDYEKEWIYKTALNTDSCWT